MEKKCNCSKIRKNIYAFLVFVFCVAFVMVMMIGVFRRTIVSGSSMEPTLHDKQNLIMVRTKYLPMLPIRHGDAVVVLYEEDMIIKRVIGLPGDTVQIVDGQLYINDQLQEESYIKEPMIPQSTDAVTLGEKQYYVMGDNRNHSLDSRMIGPVEFEEIFGVVYLEHQLQLLVFACLLLAGVLLLMWFTDRILNVKEQPAPEIGEGQSGEVPVADEQ